MPASPARCRKWIARLILLLLSSLYIFLNAAPGTGGFNSGIGRGRGGPPADAAMDRQARQNREKALKQFEDICETLVLDKEQSKKARTLFENSQKELELAYGKFSRDIIGADELAEITRGINDRLLDDFGKVLNEEQAERFDIIRKDMLDNRSRGR
jgi:hypothetical protein